MDMITSFIESIIGILSRKFKMMMVMFIVGFAYLFYRVIEKPFIENTWVNIGILVGGILIFLLSIWFLSGKSHNDDENERKKLDVEQGIREAKTLLESWVQSPPDLVEGEFPVTNEVIIVLTNQGNKIIAEVKVLGEIHSTLTFLRPNRRNRRNTS